MILRRPATMLGILALALCGVGLTSCAETPPPLATSAGVQGYVLGPGDKIHVAVYNDTQLTGDYSVTPGGNVSLPLIGNVAAGGKSTEQLQADISAALNSGYIKDANVSVDILTFRDYYILGEVNKPGEYPFSVGLDLQQAVAAAGGFTYRANRGVVFIRRAKSAEKSVDLRGAPINVMPGDTIRVGQRFF